MLRITKYHLCRCVIRNSSVLGQIFHRWSVDLVRGMAGHSKWQNIKHIKAAMDTRKAAITERCMRMIRSAIREAGTNDPSKCPKLSHAIQLARDNYIPKATIENALKSKTEASKELMAPFSMELKGPGGTFLIIETITTNQRRTEQEVRTILNKYKRFSVVPHGGITKQIFDYKGIINTELNNNSTLEKAVDDAIEAGAEDVISTKDHDGKEILQFVSDSSSFYQMRKNLENMNYIITSAELLYIPHTKRAMTEEDMEITKKMYENLEMLPEVVKIHDNIE